jgi:hypothetical protein
MDPRWVVLIGACLLIAAFVGAAVAVVRWRRRVDREWLAEFERRFPGRCPICSYWRYGHYNGFEVGEVPPPHEHCPERR